MHPHNFKHPTEHLQVALAVVGLITEEALLALQAKVLLAALETLMSRAAALVAVAVARELLAIARERA